MASREKPGGACPLFAGGPNGGGRKAETFGDPIFPGKEKREGRREAVPSIVEPRNA